MSTVNAKYLTPSWRDYLKKLCHLCILSILIITPLLYPLKLADPILHRFMGWFDQHGAFMKSLWEWQLEPVLYFGLSPLLLKWTIAQGFIIVLVVAWVLWKLSLHHRADQRRITIQVFLVILLLLYVGFSSLFISPTLHKSLMAFIMVVFCVSFFFVVRDIDKSPAFVVKAFVLLGLAALLVSLIALLQHFHLTDGFMLRFDRLRNRMGSFIGHNTGLSSFLIPSIFLSMAALTFVRSKKLRILLYGFLGLEGFIIVAAQSRGVILILLFLTPLYLLYMKKTTGLHLRFRWITTTFLVLAIIVLVQLVNVSWNPFYNKEMPLVQRLKAFHPKNLSGTRLRILVCSQQLLRESPLTGHGFNSFQYVYPEAQSDFYANHPNTLLYITDLRTQRAHNEYLQTAIELGFIGLFGALLVVFLFLKQGQRCFVEINQVWKQRLLCAVFFSLTAYLLHSFVDFPMQIPPLCLTFLFLFGIWVSCKKIWLLRQDSSPGEEPSLQPSESSPPPSKRIAHKRIIILLAVPLLVGFTIAANWVTLRPFRTDLIYFKSDMFIQTFHEYKDISTREKISLLNRAVATAKQGANMNPLHAEIQYKLSEASYLMGALCVDQWKEAQKKDNQKEAAAWKAEAMKNLLRATNRLDQTLQEFRFHSVYYLKGLVEELLARLQPDQGHFSRARENFSLAVRYSPAFAPALKDYSELLLKMSRNLPQEQQREIGKEILRLRKLIAKHQPLYYEDHFVDKVHKALLNGKNDRAITLLIDLIRVEPDKVDYKAWLANALHNDGKSREALEVLAEAEKNHPHHPLIHEAFAHIHLKQGNYKSALVHIRKRLEFKEKTRDVFEVLEAYTLKKMGEKELAQERLRILEEKAARDPRYLQNLGMVAIEYFNDYEQGIPYLEKRIKLTNPPVPHVFYVLAKYKLEQGDVETAEKLLKRALEIPPYYNKAEKLLKQIKEKENQRTNE